MILCCGEALVDMLPRKSEAGETCYAPYAGGAIFNTAIALGRLGVPTGFFSGLSTDMFGELLASTLNASGVATHYAARAARPTTLAFVNLVNGQATYVFYDEGSAGRMIAEADLPVFKDRIDALMFGGISLLPEPCASTYEALMKRAHKDRVIMIDPNIRPGFITDETTYVARIDRMLAMADLVKLSDEDLHWLATRKGVGAEEFVTALLEGGVAHVFITRGVAGSECHSRAGMQHAVGQTVKVADTIGAGDTFNAGILASLHRQGVLTKDALRQADAPALQNALELANRAAAVTVSRAGANPPWAKELGI